MLEVGCSDGRLTSILSGQVKSILSIDTDEEAIAAAVESAGKQGLRNVDFRVEDVCTIDLQPGEFGSALLALSL